MYRRAASASAGPVSQSPSRKPAMHARPPMRTARSVARIAVGPTSSKSASTPPGSSSRTRSATAPSSITTCAAPLASSAARLASCRVVAMTVAPRSAAIVIAAIPTDELPPCTSRVCPARQVERGERAPRRAERLRDRAERRPVERRVDSDHLRRRQQRVLLVAAVVRAPHLAHRGDEAPALVELARRVGHDLADRLDPEHAREAHRVARAAAARDELGAVEPERAHADEDPAFAWL